MNWHGNKLPDRENQLITRRGLLGAFAASALVAAPVYANAAGFLRGAGNIRRLHMYSGRTGERINMVYFVDGQYIGPALEEINWMMRDWRIDRAKEIDTRTIDILAATQVILNIDEAYMLLSGYRSKRTNDLLRRRSRGVAKYSLHIRGQAADVRLKSRSVQQLAKAAASCDAGGVGRYYRSNFVHMDCGEVRTWHG